MIPLWISINFSVCLVLHVKILIEWLKPSIFRHLPFLISNLWCQCYWLTKARCKQVEKNCTTNLMEIKLKNFLTYLKNQMGEKWKKKPVCETVVWLQADWVKNLVEKKWPNLSDSDMVTGGLITRSWKINFSVCER